jgi:cytochrome c
MRRVDLPIVLSLLVAALYACNKPAAEETTPPTDPGATGEAPTGEEPPPAEPSEDAEAKAAAEAEAAAAEKKKLADAQIEQGKQLYGANCASCHGANGEGKKGKPKVVGEGALPLDPPKSAKLRKGVQFTTAKDVGDWVATHMPLKKGGSLKPEEYWAILAFDLSANGIAVNEPVTPENAAAITIPRPEPAPAAEAPAAKEPAKEKAPSK